MNLYVVDASVAVKWYVPEIHSDAGEKLLDGHRELHAPDLILPEFGNIIWKKIRREEITVVQGRRIIEAFLQVPIQWHSGSVVLQSAFDAADSTSQTVYDCTYLALAVALDCEMVTADEKFYQAIRTTAFAANILWIEALL